MDWIHEKNRICLAENGEVLAYVTFPETAPGTVDVNHTVVSPVLRGQGIAGQLMEALVEDLRRDSRRAVLSCSYAVGWFAKHPECSDVLAHG